MEKIAVVTDTGSNLSFAQAKELGIYLLPLQIVSTHLITPRKFQVL